MYTGLLEKQSGKKISMMTWVSDLILAFIPLFVAIDPIGLIPLFLGITHGISAASLKKVAYQATTTAAIVAIGFLFLGKAVFQILGITVQDFQIAGGLILLGFAARDLLVSQEASSLSGKDDVGVVPLGMPLIAGPALITTLLILIETVGVTPTLIALIINLILVALAFRFERFLTRLVGISGLKAASKIISLLLAAIAVHMIRLGLNS